MRKKTSDGHLPCCFSFYQNCLTLCRVWWMLVCCREMFCFKTFITHSPGFNIMTLLIHRGVFNHCFLKKSTAMTELKTDEQSASSVFFQNQPTTTPFGFWPRFPHTTQFSCILWSTVSFLHRQDFGSGQSCRP